MFELLILGSLNDYQNNIFYLPEKREQLKIYVELSQSLNENYIYYFFNQFQVREISFSYLNIKVGNT